MAALLWLRCCHGWSPHCFGCAVVTGGGCTVVVVVTAGGCAVVVLLLRPRRWWLRCHHPTSHCSPPSSSSSSSSSSSPYLHPTSHCSPISSSSTNSLSPPQLALFADHHSTPRTLRRPITDLGVHLGIFHRKKSEILICRPYGFRGGPPAHVYYSYRPILDHAPHAVMIYTTVLVYMYIGNIPEPRDAWSNIIGPGCPMQISHIFNENFRNICTVYDSSQREFGNISTAHALGWRRIHNSSDFLQQQSQLISKYVCKYFFCMLVYMPIYIYTNNAKFSRSNHVQIYLLESLTMHGNCFV